MISPHRHFHRLAWIAVLLAFGIVVFGAVGRLSNGGLSCPDWPTCYGRATGPVHEHEIAAANASVDRAVETSKAWREQVHRMLAGSLMVLITILALLAARRRPQGIASIVAGVALGVVSIVLYVGHHYTASASLVVAGLLVLLACAIRWDNSDAARLSTVVLMAVAMQAVLGMWTVTWLLKPIVVTGHLLGGMTTFALLTWLAFATTPDRQLVNAMAPKLRGLLWIGLVLLALQIFLGGWTSSNYAALACGAEFPKCLGAWVPQHDFHQAFVLWRGIGVDYEGGVLDGPARVAIQLAHRLVAVLVFGHLLAVALRMFRSPGLKFWGLALALLVCAQVALGIGNVLLGLQLAIGIAMVALQLPLPLAAGHNLGAALLLLAVTSLNQRAWRAIP
jgi:cytochrome c oxidase assembly protein subunit 15